MNKLGKVGLFLKGSSIWEGSFTNFVNRKDGIIQKGKIRFKVDVDDNGIISHELAFFDKAGKPGDYTGSAKFKVEGNKIINLLEMTFDSNTNNEIKNHLLQGFIGENHIHVLETYDDVFSDGKIDYRRNSIHYYFVSPTEIYMISDVYVNNELLVFVNTVLLKSD